MPKSMMANWRFLFHPVWCLTDCCHDLQYSEKSKHGSGGTSNVQFVDLSASPCLFRPNAARRISLGATDGRIWRRACRAASCSRRRRIRSGWVRRKQGFAVPIADRSGASRRAGSRGSQAARAFQGSAEGLGFREPRRRGDCRYRRRLRREGVNCSTKFSCMSVARVMCPRHPYLPTRSCVRRRGAVCCARFVSHIATVATCRGRGAGVQRCTKDRLRACRTVARGSSPFGVMIASSHYGSELFLMRGGADGSFRRCRP